MENPNRIKINKIAGYIRHRDDFCFDTVEVLEDTEGVLAHYGIVEALSGEEYLLLQHELYKLAEQYEIDEVAYQTFRSEYPLLPCL